MSKNKDDDAAKKKEQEDVDMRQRLEDEKEVKRLKDLMKDQYDE